MEPGPTGMHPVPDFMVRLARLKAISIVSIRGRASGIGSELALAADLRFASREKAILSQFEVGAGFVPGGGPMARLPRLLGRGRALEILIGADDFDGALAERYGYVNRALPDAELDAFVDALATRIASFDQPDDRRDQAAGRCREPSAGRRDAAGLGRLHHLRAAAGRPGPPQDTGREGLAAAHRRRASSSAASRRSTAKPTRPASNGLAHFLSTARQPLRAGALLWR